MAQAVSHRLLGKIRTPSRQIHVSFMVDKLVPGEVYGGQPGSRRGLWWTDWLR